MSRITDKAVRAFTRVLHEHAVEFESAGLTEISYWHGHTCSHLACLATTALADAGLLQYVDTDSLVSSAAWKRADDAVTTALPISSPVTDMLAELRRDHLMRCSVVDLESAEARIDAVLTEVRAELVSATQKFGSFASAHEGYAVILEEVDELWDEVKRNDPVMARREAVQVAAMGARFLLDVGTSSLTAEQQVAAGKAIRDGAF